MIATVYAVNNYDRERMKSLMNPVSEEPTSPKQDEVIKEKDKGRPPEQRDKGGEIPDIPSEAPKVDLGRASFGQLSPSEKDTLVGILNEYIDVFAVNPESVPACKGVLMRLELKAFIRLWNKVPTYLREIHLILKGVYGQRRTSTILEICYANTCIVFRSIALI